MLFLYQTGVLFPGHPRMSGLRHEMVSHTEAASHSITLIHRVLYNPVNVCILIFRLLSMTKLSPLSILCFLNIKKGQFTLSTKKQKLSSKYSKKNCPISFFINYIECPLCKCSPVIESQVATFCHYQGTETQLSVILSYHFSRHAIHVFYQFGRLIHRHEFLC